MSRFSQDPVPEVAEGSAAYYTLLFTPTVKREAVTALFALHREFDEITTRRGEPGVAQVKLQWWDDEIRRLAAGEPRHPVTQALVDQASVPGSRELLLEMVACTSALGGALQEAALDRAVELECRRSAALMGAMARLLIDEDDADDDILVPARSIGAGARLCALLRQEPGLAPSRAQLAIEARDALAQGLMSIPADCRARLGPLMVYGQIHRLRLRRLDRTDARPTRLANALATLTEVVAAWRTARRAARATVPPPVRGLEHES